MRDEYGCVKNKGDCEVSMDTTEVYVADNHDGLLSGEDASLGLPEIPSTIGRENSLEHASVIAYRMGDGHIRGKLESFSPKNQCVVIAVGKRTIRVKFASLRFLIFTQAVLQPHGDDSLSIDKITAMSHAPKAFELIFTDNRKFHATAETVIYDHNGVHLFLDKPDKKIYRVFIPKQSLKSNNFDTSFGKGIIEHKEVVTDHGADYAKTIEVDSRKKIAIDSAEESAKETPDDGLLEMDLDCFSISKNIAELKDALKTKWKVPKEHLGELLVEQNIITQQQLYEVLIEQASTPGHYFGELVEEKGLATAEDVYKTLAYKLGISYANLSDFDVDPEVLTLFPRDLAKKHHILPLFFYESRIVMAISDPTNNDITKMAEFITGHHIEIVLASSLDIDEAIDKHYGKQEDEAVFEHIDEMASEQEDISEKDFQQEAERLGKEKPIVRLVQNMIIDAVRSKASDIHVRPAEKHVDLIYRIDGSMTQIRTFRKQVLAAVVSRIKIIGRMDISKRRIPQDGRAKVVLNGRPIDLRISVMPTVNGESIVIRILDTSSGLKDLNELGFSKNDYDKMSDMISRSNGVLLVTGPTGSGKSTTQYAAIKAIRKTNVNIITAEDPVEYRIDGIEQMQVNAKTGYTFARILRNILRHDPDVIMVGEIRDKETANIAIESALTGHLVLSTLHTNNAAATVTRLLEMGIEPYLINDTLLGVLAQRLVRLNCKHCLSEEILDDAVVSALNISPDEVFYRGTGCEHCNDTGYHGRMAVYELLTLSPPIHHLINNNASADEIHEKATQEGMSPLTHNALCVARESKTSLAEVYRVRLG